MIKILAIASDRAGVGWFRTIKPHTKLQELFPKEFFVDIKFTNEGIDVNELVNYDIVHFHKTIVDYPLMDDIFDKLNKSGVITIMDVDDYWSPDMKHPAYHLIKESKLGNKIVNNLKKADYVTTTTEVFAQEIKKYNKNVVVLPNAIDINEPQYVPNPTDSDKLRFGWLGGSSHKYDIKLLDGMVNKLKSDCGDKLKMVLCGFDTRGRVTNINPETGEKTQRNLMPQETVWFEYETIFTDKYKTVDPAYRQYLLSFNQQDYPNAGDMPYRRVWTKPVNSYATNYNLFDVSLAPLFNNKFNCMKSQLKVVESGFHKKALIASEVGPYKIDLVNAYERGGTINEKGNAFLIPNGKDTKLWAKYAKKLIENPELVTMLSENLHNTVKDKYELSKVTTDRAEFYKSLKK
jgi:glycosyltransferase involved in cell wall biosynthesis